mmetsp:Transcript_102686/g.290734  ORF Transcript_102686/g.290734 Transcript_102686/m.290734 type:complete len:1037 (-) Transcript_102686:220-3330(-)
MGRDEVDFEASGKSEEELGQEIAHALNLKGYCVIDLGQDDRLGEALDDVQDLESFESPPPQVIEGLLGTEGSSEFAWLPSATTEEQMSGTPVAALNTEFLGMARCTQPFFEGSGLTGMKVSETMVLRGGEADEDGMELDEETCSFWLGMFLSAKVKLIYFMGPGTGTLELQPFDEECESITIDTRPDMLLILRCDSILERHTSTSSDYAMCAWIATPNETGTRGWYAPRPELRKNMPAVNELCTWMTDRLQLLSERDVSGESMENIPRSWQRLMRTEFFRNISLPVAVRGVGTHSPGCQDADLLWKSLNNGVDYVTPIPFIRWDHAPYYDPDPQCYLQSHVFTGGITKTNVCHAQFIDGHDLFDNKFFQISLSETTGMEPQQRHILETSYEGLFMAGYTKKQLMNNYIAVFTGCTNPEAMYINYPQGAGAGNVSQAITSNRTSFVLGIMGPSTSIDCEMSSSHMALMVGCSAVTPNNDWRTKTGGDSTAAICGGVFMQVAGPFMWPRFNAYMNPIGRCFSFDANGNGYVRGESCSSICLKTYMDKVDGEIVASNQYTLGTFVGWRMTNNGRGASITAPHAAGMQETLYAATRHAGLETLDVDAVECHGTGGLLDDSVEVTSIAKVLRSVEGSESEPLILGAVKTQVGAQCESCGMTQVLKVIYNILYANNAPTLHCKQINPHMDMGTDALFVNTDAMPYRDRHVFHGSSSRGFGGSNTHMISWYAADKILVDHARPAEGMPFSFWPGGGGMLERGEKPASGYHITGSWNGWEEPAQMQQVEDGIYVHVVTLGMNRCESFQILLDGDEDRVINPGMPEAPSGCAVVGPYDSVASSGLTWMIDGRVSLYPYEAEPYAQPGEGAEALAIENSVDYVPVATRDKGNPGDQYKVTLAVAGKYRAVSWKKVYAVGDETEMLSDPAVQGDYYISSTAGRWGLDKMVASAGVPGLYTLDVGPITATTCEFQVFRNKDWGQCIYPPTLTVGASAEAEQEACGPDAGGQGKHWCLKGRFGDVFTVEFQRTFENGVDKMRVSWRPKA